MEGFGISARVAPAPQDTLSTHCPTRPAPGSGALLANQRCTAGQSTAQAAMSSMEQENRDVYDFPLAALTQQQQSARAACAAYEARRRSKWQEYVEKQQLPTGSILKRYCRKVCTPQAAT